MQGRSQKGRQSSGDQANNLSQEYPKSQQQVNPNWVVHSTNNQEKRSAGLNTQKRDERYCFAMNECAPESFKGTVCVWGVGSVAIRNSEIATLEVMCWCHAVIHGN